ncbi:MAG: 2,3,4,5-tetrahydropyridine-2,6-dicarboxylate N-succinyltransferase, partial [Rhodobiaceae bacterium]|nr:2,3,4,5-tetrahydropyridine-2,6-dicarboxylate N-succinyltransferase [Rhodobiaceae bacterium]
MTPDDLKSIINTAFDNVGTINTKTVGEVRDAVEEALTLLDRGDVRVAEKGNDGWT